MTPNAAIVVDHQGSCAITFLAHDADDPRFCIQARIDTQTDYLTFRIVTRILSTGAKSAVNPNDFFAAMMNHFAGQVGGPPAAIRAIWKDSNPEYVTNLVRFNAALAAGDDEEAAAAKTFTGRMAVHYGYTTITLGHMVPRLGPPPYTVANVYFKK